MSKLHHIIKESSLKENAPALIMCHGYGSDENDLFSFASELPEELFIISVRAPYPLQPMGNAWYAINFEAEKGKWNDIEQAKTSRDEIASFIDFATEKYPINANNITLLGFSQGAILSLSVGISYPKKIKNIIALSGFILKDIMPEEIEDEVKNLNVFTSHGSVDQVIPVDWARQTTPFLTDLKIEHTYKEYPVGHGVAPQNFHDFKAWLSPLI